MSLARNIEMKAIVGNLVRARATAERVATARVGIERQRDTYFNCRSGRLKLREIGDAAVQLIAYERADRPDAKASDYRLVNVSDAGAASALRELLDAALGTLVVVEKSREIFLYQNVRIHLDEVARLGTFIEFEAVVAGTVDDATAQEQVAWLTRQFEIGAADLISGSYSDMLLLARDWPLIGPA
jgi:predicted adenylyl cyclase CyaB